MEAERYGKGPDDACVIGRAIADADEDAVKDDTRLQGIRDERGLQKEVVNQSAERGCLEALSCQLPVQSLQASKAPRSLGMPYTEQRVA